MVMISKLRSQKESLLTNFMGFAVDSEINNRVNYVYNDGEFGLIYADECIHGPIDEMETLIPRLKEKYMDEFREVLNEAREWTVRTND